MKILVSLSFLLVFSLLIIDHNETNGGSYIKRENPIPKNSVMDIGMNFMD